MKINVHLSDKNPVSVNRNKDLSLQARVFYNIISCDAYFRPNGMDIESLKEYFRQFTDEEDYKIVDYILELVEKKLIELE